MLFFKKSFITFFFILFLLPLLAQEKVIKINTDVLVVGGTASGISAGIQSARMGVNTLVVESTTWLGGMLTSAGVSAFDGNHLLPSGLFGEFREQLYKVYGGPNKVATGWVSNTLFEPHVGDSIFKAMSAIENKLTIKYQYDFVETILQGQKVLGAKFISNMDSTYLWVYAKRTIDATELGDVMASAKIPYDLGMESNDITHENVNHTNIKGITQDLTFVGVLKNYKTPQPLIPRPIGYDSTEFDGSNSNFYHDSKRKKPEIDANKMLAYGKLPNDKFMLNWPIYGNDIYLEVVDENKEQRLALLEKAKQQTLRFIYFIQKDLGFKNYALANDEFPTKDLLALYPYYRESRRLQGVVRMTIQNISAPFDTPEALYRTGIAVGDYPIDHHHKKNPNAPQHLDFFPVPSFNIALGTLIPPQNQNIIIAEKSISVSNVVNGTTRLQPCVLQIGQAAGMLAALSVLTNQAPIKVPVRLVQEKLLNAGVYIMPYMDVEKTNMHFNAVQKMGATGLLKGVGTPSGWANKTYFNPTKNVQANEFVNTWLSKFPNDIETKKMALNDDLTIGEAIYFASKLSKSVKSDMLDRIKLLWNHWNFIDFNEQRPIQRIELAAILNEVKVFEVFGVDLKGNFINSK
ncbi:MAG: FAD-dependent oxidoreductase [Chitinophagia bacterium]|jgi:hypothetical protein|nr:FAD-dependent oxidoreductase [Chitinophagia bacterium]